MRRTSILVLGPAVLATLLLLLASAGCGGGGKKTAATTAATTTAAATTTTKTSDLSGLASASNCKQLADLSAQYSKAISGAAGGQDLKKTGRLLEEFASKTPADIRPDFKVVADAYSKLAGVLADLKPGTTPDAAALAKLQKLVAGLDQAKLSTATQRIAKWVQQNCHA